MSFSIEVSINNTVRVWHRYDHLSICPEIISISEEEADEINQWVVDSGIGIRTSWDRWWLFSDKAVMLFKIRFSS